MSYHGVLGAHTVAISISESPDMPVLGLSNEHLRDAMTEIARYLLALGAHLVYGGDLRANGFSELLFELVARHRQELDEQTGVINYLAWPVHIRMDVADIAKALSDLSGAAELVCLTIEGVRQPMAERRQLEQQEPTDDEWSAGLTMMRHVVLSQSHARIVLGGRVDQYKGVMPGIAEEALLSLKARQPLFLLGGFGGCARDIAEILGIIEPWAVSRSGWPGRNEFKNFTVGDLNNGLTREENMTLARTPHIDQAIALILRGLLNSSGAGA